jgi:hypothetical protein
MECASPRLHQNRSTFIIKIRAKFLITEQIKELIFCDIITTDLFETDGKRTPYPHVSYQFSLNNNTLNTEFLSA